jgi:hypothetical protein
MSVGFNDASMALPVTLWLSYCVVCKPDQSFHYPPNPALMVENAEPHAGAAPLLPSRLHAAEDWRNRLRLKISHKSRLADSFWQSGIV